MTRSARRAYQSPAVGSLPDTQEGRHGGPITERLGVSVISGKPVYTLPPKPTPEMLKLTFANRKTKP